MTRATDRLERQLVAAVVSDRPQVPEAGRLVWQWFGALHRRRSFGMTGPQPISHAEMEAFARVERLPLQPHHAQLLRAMDDAWLDHARDSLANRSAEDGVKTLPPASTHAISADLFDAVF
ncbi:phage tail assembly chaperone [Mangrovicella endophytica]|uniref:phage tail assembly chaperone n=1 Tax=Mangrovicella endophytica TaxID=2066697 RepID=UPI000C9DA91E|nr:hypothetical protein [Mangrovicella endophytica]